jgi:hypothetical protein
MTIKAVSQTRRYSFAFFFVWGGGLVLFNQKVNVENVYKRCSIGGLRDFAHHLVSFYSRGVLEGFPGTSHEI